MKKVLVLGAGLVTKPMIDYYLDTCGYEVVLASRTVSVHNEVTAEFPDRREKRFATMQVEGIPHGDTAMSRAVALPTAIAGRLVLEGKLSARGVIMPTGREIYEPVLAEMKTFGFEFAKRAEPL